MLKHIFKLVWNRRTANLLVIIEVAAAFLVSFVLLAMVFFNWFNYRIPLGFEYDGTWEVSIRVEDRWQASDGEAMQGVLDALRAEPGVAAAHVLNITPFRNWNWRSTVGDHERERFGAWINVMSDGAPADLGLELIMGRWFDQQDAGQPHRAVVVNRHLVERAFAPGEDPLGKVINPPSPDEGPGDDYEAWKIVGVFEDFRQRGEFFEQVPYVIRRHNLDDPEESTNSLFVRVEAGTPAAFEERILNITKQIAPTWNVTINRWSHLRDQHHAEITTPLKIAGLIAAFMLLMVALGLIGVLWQDVVRRTQEIGLRRALGASSGQVRWQIVLEMLMLGFLGVVLGTILAVQFPMLELVDEVNWRSTWPAVASAAAGVLALVGLSALYPGWAASRRQPADALRYE